MRRKCQIHGAGLNLKEMHSHSTKINKKIKQKKEKRESEMWS